MSSSSSKPRTSSPFRFRKTSSINQSKSLIPSPSSSGSLTPTSTSKSIAFVARSLTPNRSRSNIPQPPSITPSITPQKFRLSSASSVSAGSPRTPTSMRDDFLSRAKENVSVTVRFRPLSQREIQRGDEVAWYADGDTTVRSELNPSTVYAFDRVFGPATTTRGVYDVAAQHVVSGAMEGVNGTVFAYGVTSSGKTHTMHGDQKSPGIIPLAVKDVFSIIQETPSREFLLRVSYLEIYNEVINDLLDPIGQNLRVREDTQGTYVEGIKEEVVLSPAHALSLIAAGEEHRHVGSNNFNLLSSRSHTIFTLTVESSPRGEGYTDEDVTLSQLNLIDLAGSESSKTETTGLRRKEGSYINKSLLTLGTVIAKLSDGKASHIPYRDSKLTRLLQSSLSGHGRISLICTITPASSNNEETHNTLKFAHRAKRIEIHAASNRILDEKSLIKKYQKEISSLKSELEQLKRGILEQPYLVNASHEDLVHLRQQLEAGQVKLQSRLEEEEQAKAALMGRIQRLTKLILVSTKNTIPPVSVPEVPTHRRRHSFGEEELAYLPDKRRDLTLEDDDEGSQGGPDSEMTGEGRADSSGMDDGTREEKKSNKKRGMLAWFKIRKSDSLHSSPSGSFDTENSPNGSPGAMVHFEPGLDLKGPRRKSFSRRVDELSTVDSFPEPTQAGELFSATVRGRRPPPTGTTMADQIDLLREQVKMLAGEVAFCTSSLKRLSEQATNSPDDPQLQVQIEKTREEIQEKRRHMRLLEQRIKSSDAPQLNSPFEMSQQISKLMTQLNEKAFDLEIKSADNRILQEQLQAKTEEINELRETVESLQQQLQMASMETKINHHRPSNSLVDNTEEIGGWLSTGGLSGELRYVEQNGSESDVHDRNSHATSKDIEEADTLLQSQVLLQAAEMEKLKQERARLVEEKEGLQIQTEKLAEESAYAKELASQAAVELKNLAEEVTKLSFHNSKLQNELVKAQELAFQNAKLQNDMAKLQIDLAKSQEIALLRTTTKLPSPRVNGGGNTFNRGGTSLSNGSGNGSSKSGKVHSSGNFFDDIDMWQLDSETAIHELKRELEIAKEKEATLEATMAEREEGEAILQKKLDDAKQREMDLENDLAGMWVLVAKMKKDKDAATDQLPRVEFQDSYQEEFRSNGGDDGILGAPESTLQGSSKPIKLKDSGTVPDQFVRAEQESNGDEFWSNGGGFAGGSPGALDEEELYTGLHDSTFLSVDQSASFGSGDGPPGECEIKSTSTKCSTRIERHEINGSKMKGGADGERGRSLEELKSFMEEERRRGAELGALVSQLKASSIPTSIPNSHASSLKTGDRQSGSSQASHDLDTDIWQFSENSSYYKSQ